MRVLSWKYHKSLKSSHQYRLFWAHFAAGIATRTEIGENRVFLIRGHRDCVDRTMLGTKGAADAIVGDRVGDEGAALPGRAMAV